MERYGGKFSLEKDEKIAPLNKEKVMNTIEEVAVSGAASFDYEIPRPSLFSESTKSGNNKIIEGHLSHKLQQSFLENERLANNQETLRSWFVNGMRGDSRGDYERIVTLATHEQVGSFEGKVTAGLFIDVVNRLDDIFDKQKQNLNLGDSIREKLFDVPVIKKNNGHDEYLTAKEAFLLVEKLVEQGGYYSAAAQKHIRERFKKFYDKPFKAIERITDKKNYSFEEAVRLKGETLSHYYCTAFDLAGGAELLERDRKRYSQCVKSLIRTVMYIQCRDDIDDVVIDSEQGSTNIWIAAARKSKELNRLVETLRTAQFDECSIDHLLDSAKSVAPIAFQKVMNVYRKVQEGPIITAGIINDSVEVDGMP